MPGGGLQRLGRRDANPLDEAVCRGAVQFRVVGRVPGHFRDDRRLAGVGRHRQLERKRTGVI